MTYFKEKLNQFYSNHWKTFWFIEYAVLLFVGYLIISIAIL